MLTRRATWRSSPLRRVIFICHLRSSCHKPINGTKVARSMLASTSISIQQTIKMFNPKIKQQTKIFISLLPSCHFNNNNQIQSIVRTRTMTTINSNPISWAEHQANSVNTVNAKVKRTWPFKTHVKSRWVVTHKTTLWQCSIIMVEVSSHSLHNNIKQLATQLTWTPTKITLPMDTEIINETTAWTWASQVETTFN